MQKNTLGLKRVFFSEFPHLSIHVKIFSTDNWEGRFCLVELKIQAFVKKFNKETLSFGIGLPSLNGLLIHGVTFKTERFYLDLFKVFDI